MSEGLIAVKNTAKKYLKGAADFTIRKRFLWAYMQKHGRIKTGGSGADCNWNVEAREPEVRQNGDAGQQVFAEHDAYEQLVIDIRGYVATDRLTLKKKLMNDEPLAIVNLYDTKLPKLTKSMRNNLGGELYIDGNAAGNENRLHGLKSFMGRGACASTDIVAEPDDTYAGKSTKLKALGGSWSTQLGSGKFPNATIATDWPYGQGTSEYDYIAPKMLNLTSTRWPSGSAVVRDNLPFALRRARTWCSRLTQQDEDDAPFLHLLSSELYDDFEDYMEAKFRVIVPHKGAQDLGFDNVLNFNGSMVKHEFDTPAGEGYGINVNEMSLFTIHDDLFYSFGPDWDMESLSYLFLCGLFGNERYNPRAFSQYGSYA